MNTLQLRQLLQALAHDKGLQHLVDLSHEILEKPLYIVDLGFKLLAKSKDSESDDPFWMELSAKGYFSYETVSFFKSNRLIERVRRSRLPILTQEYQANHPNLICGLFQENRLIGNLAIVGDAAGFTESDIETVTLLKDVLTVALQKNTLLYRAKGLIHEHFLKDLIEGRIQQEDTIADRAHSLDFNLKDTLYLLTVQTQNDDLPNTPLPYLRERLEQLLPDSLTIAYEDHLIALFSCEKNQALPDSETRSLLKFLKENALTGGISQRFSKLSTLPTAYRQTQQALRLGQRLTPQGLLHPYQDAAFEDLIGLAAETSDLRSFCHPDVLLLDDLDRSNSGALVQSLYQYLITGKSLSTAADTLQVHRNTLNYRIQKITALTGLDLDDGVTVFQAIFSARILAYLQKR